MYAIIEDGGKQYKVQEGQILDVELRKVAEGVSNIDFEKVLLLGEGSDSKIGTPIIEGAKVLATIQEQIKAPKIVNIHFIRRKGHLTRKGHRQQYLRVKIDKIVA